MHRYIYKLNITGGLALIPLEITADDHFIGKQAAMIYFHEEDRKGDTSVIRWFPINNTIIMERIDNPDYVRCFDRTRTR